MFAFDEIVGGKKRHYIYNSILHLHYITLHYITQVGVLGCFLAEAVGCFWLSKGFENQREEK